MDERLPHEVKSRIHNGGDHPERSEQLTAPRAEDLDDQDVEELLAEERELTLAFQRGEHSAYEAIYERYSARVESVCCRMLGDRFDAQEASQETFLRVYQSLARFNGRYQLQAWITRIATNVCLDHLRARARKPSDATPLEILDLESDPADVSDPEHLYIRNAEGRRIRRVLASLPPLHRAAIVLRDFEGFSYADIAAALDLSEGQVKALIHRARRGFRKTWVGNGMAALLPWRLLPRVKEGEVAGKESASQAMASASQAAASCNTVLQSCSQFVSERVAPAFAAAVLGTASVGAAVATGDNPAMLPKEHAGIMSSASLGDYLGGLVTDAGSGKGSGGGAGKESDSDSSEPAAATSSSSSSEGEAQPTPSPAPSPTPTASSSPKPSPSPSPSPSPPPYIPPPLEAAVGFDRGAIPFTSAVVHENRASCRRSNARQRLELEVADDGRSYPGVLSADVTSGIGFELTVTVNHQRIRYIGGGARVGETRPDPRHLRLSFRGSYGTGASNTYGLTSSGRFEASLTLDCKGSVVITESVVLSG